MPNASGRQEIRGRGLLVALAVLVILTDLSGTVQAFSGTTLGLSSRAATRHLSQEYYRSRRTQSSAIGLRLQPQSGFGGRRGNPTSLWFGGSGTPRSEFAFGGARSLLLVVRRGYDRRVAGRSSCILVAKNDDGIAASSPGEDGSTKIYGTGDGVGYVGDDDGGEAGGDIAGVGYLGDDDGEDDEDDGDPGGVIVVGEEGMREEWIERGFDPATFEPQLLLEIWEAEEEDLEDDDEGEEMSMIGTGLEEAAIEATRRRSLRLSQRDQRNPRTTRNRNMDNHVDDFEEDEEADVEAVMAAAAEESERDRRTRGDEGGRDVRTAPKHAVSTVDEEEDEGSEGSGGDSVGGRAVGIDLGTTNSAVAVIVDGQPIIIKNADGKFTTPSVVSYTSDNRKRNQRHVAGNGQNNREEDEQNADNLRSGVAAGGGVILGVGETPPGVFVGAAAVERLAIDPRSTYSSVKRVMGRTVKEAREAGVGLGALNVDQGQPLVQLKCPAKGEGKTVSPEEVSAEILRALLRDAEEFIGGGAKVKRAVVAVPAYFTPAQCEATQLAGRMAGLEKVKLMREPEAAALAYGLNKGGDELILVFDLGGGTFDVSVLEVGGGIAEVVATSGDNHLGGDDFDQAIAEWLFGQVVSLGGNDLRNDPVATRRMVEAARAARERLTTWTETEVSLPLGAGRTGSTSLTRKQMETVISEPLKRVMQPLREAALMADVSLPGDTGALMVYDAEDPREEREGGNPNLRTLRKQQSKARKKSRELATSSRAQAHSMAEIARNMEGGRKLRSFPQGRSIDQVVFVGGATRMPCVQKLVAGITGVKPKRTVDPDRAVALGAAVYAGILEGEVEGQEVMTAWQASVYRMMATSGMMK